VPTDVTTLLYEAGLYLAANGIGTLGSDIFLNQLPNSPANCVALFAEGGESPSHGLNPMELPTLQVLIRDEIDISGLRKTILVFKLLHDQWNVLPSIRGRVLADAKPGAKFLSDSGLPTFPLNFTWTLSPSPL